MSGRPERWGGGERSEGAGRRGRRGAELFSSLRPHRAERLLRLAVADAENEVARAARGDEAAERLIEVVVELQDVAEDEGKRDAEAGLVPEGGVWEGDADLGDGHPTLGHASDGAEPAQETHVGELVPVARLRGVVHDHCAGGRKANRRW